MLIDRPQLIRRIRPFYSDGRVKVITGMRRTGKSSLLRLIANDMTATLGRPESSFVFLNFERPVLPALRDPLKLHDRIVEAAARSPARLTVFLDEIQSVGGWGTCVSSLLADDVCDIFVTGSNSRLLSDAFAALPAGRAVEFQVFPFSFAEFRAARRQLEGSPLSDLALWQEYLTYGGMPGVLQHRSLPASHECLLDVFTVIVLKDIARRRNVRSAEALEELCRRLVMEAGRRISAGDLEKHLKSEKLPLSRDALLEQLQAGAEAGAFIRLETTDLHGERVRRFRPKTYVADHGFREALFPSSNARDIDQTLENIVCIELLRRGWSLRTGDAQGREIDFIADRSGERMYVQVSYLLASEETVEREFAPLRTVPDNWPKLVLSMDPVTRSRDGIRHENILEFLLSEED